MLGVNNYLYAAGYTPSGTHKVRFGNPTVQPSVNGTTLAKPIPRVEVTSPFGLMMNGDMAASDTFAITASGPNVRVTSSWVYTLQVDNAFVTSAQSAVYPYNVNLAGVSTLNDVNGTYAPGFTSVFTATPGALRNAPGIQYSNVNFHVAYTLTDTLTTTVNTLAPFGPYAGNVAMYNTGTILDLNGKRMRIAGGMDANTNAVLKMINPADTLMMGDGSNAASGNLYLDGGANSTLTNGTIILRGNTTLTNVTAGASHKLVVTDSGLPAATRSWSFNSNSTLGSVVLRGSSALTLTINASYTLLGSFDLQGGATLTSSWYYTWHVTGPVTTSALSSVTNPPYANAFNFQLAHASGTANVNGVWSPGVTRFMTAGQTVKPSLAYQSVAFAASNSFSGRTTVNGDLTATGTGSVMDIGGQTVVVAGNFALTTGALLKMTAANDFDSLIVAGTFNSDNGAANSNVTAGAIRVRGDVYAFRLAPTGSSTFILDTLASAQPQAFNNNAQSWNKVRILTNRYVRFDNNHTFNDSVQVLGPATIGYIAYNGQTYAFLGPLSTSAGSTVTGGIFQLSHPTGTSLVNGTWTAGVTRMMSAGQAVKPSLAYQQLDFNAANSFAGNMTIAGNLNVNNGTLALGAFKHAVGGALTATGSGTQIAFGGSRLSTGAYFTLNSGATLSMSNLGDTLAVGTASNPGQSYFQSDNGLFNSTVTDGVIRVRGDVNANRLISTGNAKMILDSAISGANQNLYTNGGAVNRLQVLTNRNVAMSTSMAVADSFVVSTPVFVGQNTGATLTLNGPASTVALSTLNPSALTFGHPTAAANITGSIALPNGGTLALSGLGQTVPVATRFTYTRLNILANATASLPLGAAVQLGTGPGGGNITGTLDMGTNASLSIPSTSSLHVCTNLTFATSPPASISNLGIFRIAQAPAALGGTVTALLPPAGTGPGFTSYSQACP